MFNIKRITVLCGSFRTAVAIVSAMLCVMVMGCVNDGPDGDEYSLQPGALMPSFEVVTTEGDTLTNESFAGCCSVIVLFSPECPDCLRELPILQHAYEQGLLPGQQELSCDFGEESDSARWLCISRSSTYEAVMRLWDSERLTMPVSVQTDAVVFHLFASSGVPRVYIFGPDQRLIKELPLER